MNALRKYLTGAIYAVSAVAMCTWCAALTLFLWQAHGAFALMSGGN
jgi:hypothetical protein